VSRNLLPYKLRKRWDEIILTEGVALGLSECQYLLENRMVNAILGLGLIECLKHFAPEDMDSRKQLLGIADEKVFIQCLFSHKWSLKWRHCKIRKLKGLECGDMLSDINLSTYSFLHTAKCSCLDLNVAEQKVEAA